MSGLSSSLFCFFVAVVVVVVQQGVLLPDVVHCLPRVRLLLLLLLLLPVVWLYLALQSSLCARV